MKANNFIEAEGLVSELDMKAFMELKVEQSVSFEVLRMTGWCKELLKIREDLALSLMYSVSVVVAHFQCAKWPCL